MTSVNTSSEGGKNPYECPKCGSPLILKEGQYGRFMACPNYPDCRYTRAMWTYQVTGEKPYCEKCKGKGKLPLIKNGKVIPFTWVFCSSCRKEFQEEHEWYPKLKPEDFDFAMSYNSYRSLCELHGWQDPGPDRPPEIETISPLEGKVEPEWSQSQWQYVQQLRAQMLHQQKELLTHLTPLKEKKQQGIKIDF